MIATQDRIREQVRTLPEKPGVYLFQDGSGAVLYVGKAASLRDRVRSYFTAASALSTKTQNLVEQARDLEFFVTGSEQDALILECTLIKRHRPPYNVLLRDDKSFPYLKITLNEEWPRVQFTRRLEQDGAQYFGPFASAGSLRQTISLLRRFFPFCTCKRPVTETAARPCFYYYIHRCLAPGSGNTTREEYGSMVRQVILFLEGKQEEVIREIRSTMEEASERLHFERAALLRDQIRAMQSIIENQRSAAMVEGDQDVVALATERDLAYVEVFFIRSSKLVGKEHFLVEGARDEEPGRVMEGFVKGYYDSATSIPPRVLLQHRVEDMPLFSWWLSGKKGARVALRVPRTGQEKKLIRLVEENARQGLAQLKVKQLSSPESLTAALEELGRELGLPRPPRRVECYDISDIRGSSAVGSMVVFEEGKPKPEHYRRFKIRTVSAPDDYAMMREMLRRRFARMGEKAAGNGSPEAWGLLPDLVLIDGGRGHLGAALEALQEAGAAPLNIASIAKEKEEIFLPGKDHAVLLPSSSPALYLVQRIRDEAHRFALSYHHRLRRKASLGSVLDEIPGIGPKRKRTLLLKFGTVKGIREASVEELASVPGISPLLARRLKEQEGAQPL